MTGQGSAAVSPLAVCTGGLLLAGAVGGLPLLPVGARVVLVLVFVLFGPGAACAALLQVRDPVEVLTLCVGVSVSVLLVLSMGSLLLGGLVPYAVLAVDLVLTAVVLGISERRGRR